MQPLEETVPNTAINVAVVAVSIAVFLWEENRGQVNFRIPETRSSNFRLNRNSLCSPFCLMLHTCGTRVRAATHCLSDAERGDEKEEGGRKDEGKEQDEKQAEEEES